MRELNLYQADGSHPTLLGTYLTACVFFDVLTGQKSNGAPSLMAVHRTPESLRSG